MAVMSPAEANQNLSGTITDSDPLVTIYEPTWAGDAQGCAGALVPPTTAHADAFDYVAKSTGLRTVRVKVDPAQIHVAVYLYRNGTCAAGDFEADNPTEQAAGIVDLVNVPVDFGDQLKVLIASPSDDVPLPWSATITEPPSVTGKATHRTVGLGRKYLTLPKAINCSNHHATVNLKKKVRKKVRSIVFTANNKRLKKITHLKNGHHKKFVFKHIPAGTTKLKATVTLRSGTKVHATRAYYRCL